MEALKQNLKKKISANIARKLIAVLAFIFVFEILAFPVPTLASAQDDPYVEDAILREINGSAYYNVDGNPYLPETQINNINNHLPKIDYKSLKDQGYHSISAYNSEAAQTDSDPCTTANGFNVCRHGQEDTIAANFLKFGTKVRIPALFGDRVFIVRDRMNSRYTERVDIWMLKKSAAIKFGVKFAKIEIVEP